MKKNFRIADLFILLESAGARWDLRNELKLSRIEIDDTNKTARIIFSGRMPVHNEEEALAMEFFHTEFVRCSVSLDSPANVEGRCLASAGYLPKEKRSVSDRVYSENECDDKYCIMFKFEDSSYIAIAANAAFAYALTP